MRSMVLLLALVIIAPATFAAEKAMSVPTDAKAKYTILEIGGKWPNRTIVTKRLYNCSNNTVKYLGTGDSPAKMAQSMPDPNMAPIIPESIADYVGRQACKP